MNRATIIYFLMLLLTVAGMWAIISYGETLLAPEDFAGKWELVPIESAASTRPAIDRNGWGTQLIIEQSGRYFVFLFDHGPKINLSLSQVDDATKTTMLSGTEWKVSIKKSTDARETITLMIEGPDGSDVWRARRTERLFPLTQREGVH